MPEKVDAPLPDLEPEPIVIPPREPVIPMLVRPPRLLELLEELEPTTG